MNFASALEPEIVIAVKTRVCHSSLVQDDTLRELAQ